MTRASPIERAVLVVAALTALLVAAPVLTILGLAAQPAPDVWPDLVAYVLPVALRDTALLLTGVAALTLVFGAGTAWLVTRCDFIGRGVLLWLLPLPLAIPTYIAAYVYADLFEPLGLVHRTLALWMPMPQAVHLLPSLRSLPGAIVIIASVLYPYVYLSMRAALQMQGADVGEAARTLGARRIQIIWRVSVPMVRPALAVGLALVALETLNDIGASEYLGVRTLTVSIFVTWLNRGSLAGAAQLACVMLAIVALLIAIERYGRRNTDVAFSSESPRPTPRRALRGVNAWLACAACAIPAALGFIVPLAYLMRESIRRGLLANLDAVLAREALHSISFAALATIAALLLALAVLLAQRWRPSAMTALSVMTAQTGYALPGLVLALGLLTPVLFVDNAFNAVAGWFGTSAGLLVVGSGAAVVIAYVIRFLAVPTGFMRASFARIPADYDDSADVAGATRGAALRRIHLPLLGPALVGAAIIVFVDCLKELPATLLLRPLNVDTLATSIYQYASRGSFEEGALAALLIVAASVPPVVWLTRFADVPQGPA